MTGPPVRLDMSFVPEAALIALREGLEAFLIVGILLGFVMKLGRPDARKWVWLGLAAGIAASLAVGLLVQAFLLDSFEDGGGAAWFELVAALTAVGVLTYMVVWMWRHTRTLMAGLRQKVGEALTGNALWAIGLLTFSSVIREGLEVVLFYGALAGRNAAFDLAWSGLVGMVVSAAIVLALQLGAIRFDLQRFFAVTGILLVFIAAGLLVHSVHAASDLGLLPHGHALWDTSGVLHDDSAAGRILHALVGYTAQPTLLQALLYFGYLFGVGLPYLAGLGWFRRQGEPRRGRIGAAATAVGIALLMVGWGAANPVDGGHGHGLGATVADPLEEAASAEARRDGKLGILIRDHGEYVSYNASTYETVKQFLRDLWPCTGLPPELLAIDTGTYFVDGAHPFAAAPASDARLVDARLQPWALPAVPVWDPVDAGALKRLGAEGLYYHSPIGPGLGEGDIFEIVGLGAYKDWAKMGNHSPRHGQGMAVWSHLEARLQEAFGDDAVVAFAHGLDPKVDPGHTLQAAARRLADAGVTQVIDVYQSSIHSDVMDTKMMWPHAEHALRTAGYDGPIVRAGQPGHAQEWAEATRLRVEAWLAALPANTTASVHLVHHGANPNADSPCLDGPDAYHANARQQFALASESLVAAHPGLPVRMVYGQGAGAADDGVLSPQEALGLDRQEGVQQVLMLPYEVWGDGVDSLVALRESLGMEPQQAPYYDDRHETRLTHQGVSVLVASGFFEPELRSEALLRQVAAAMGGPGEAGGGHMDGSHPG
jgi:high-affinity iron transporter